MSESRTPPVDTSTAGENWWIDDRMVLHADNYACGFTGGELAKFERIKDRHNASLAALRGQLAQAQKETQEEAALNLQKIERIQKLEAALKQKDELREKWDDFLVSEVKHHCGIPSLSKQELAFRETFAEFLAIQPDSSALKTVIEAKTAELREALQQVKEIVCGRRVVESNQTDIMVHGVHLTESDYRRFVAILATSAQKAGQQQSGGKSWT